MLRPLALAALLAVAVPAAAQAPYHGYARTGLTVGPSAFHTTEVDVTSFAAEGVATLGPRVDLSASVASVRTRQGYLSGWSASAAGTVYPLAARGVWLGLTGGMTRVDAGYSEGTAFVSGASLSGRVGVGSLALVPVASVSRLDELDGRVDGDGTVALGLALGVVVPTRSAPLVIEPVVAFSDDAGFRDSQDVLNYDISYGLALRLLFSRGG